METSGKSHWEDVYRRKDAATVSWYRPHLETSLALLREAGLSPRSRVVDAGGGASSLVDDLLDAGVRDATIVDLSTEALEVAKRRLGPRARDVHWLAGDLLDIDFAPGRFDLWHDRAVLHFLTSEADAARYVEQASRAVVPDGYAVIGGFAPGGPERCSGLTVARRSAGDIASLFEPHFEAVRETRDLHVTPAGHEQAFVYVLLRRR